MRRRSAPPPPPATAGATRSGATPTARSRSGDHGKGSPEPLTRVYRSADPLAFGIDEDDRYLVAELPLAAPEIIHHDSQDYLAALRPGLDGIRVTRLLWRSA